MRSQYDIIAQKLLPDKPSDSEKVVNKYYDNLIFKDYHNTICFNNEPTKEDVIDVLKILMPEYTFVKESIEIKYIRELTPEELI